MSKTLYDLIDSWTMNWNRGLIEIIMNQVSAPFYERKLVFFLFEEIWDVLEVVDDPQEFMTEQRAIKMIENILSSQRNERAAKFVQVEVVESPQFMVSVLNAEETIAKNPGWFSPWEGMTLSSFGDKLASDDK